MATRPQTLATFVGQEAVKRQVALYVSAHCQGRPFPHTLLAGPPGLGKTTMARVIAEECYAWFVTVPPAAMAHRRALVEFLGGIFAAMETEGRRYDPPIVHSVLFFDEIHQLGLDAAEVLYYLMEDGILQTDQGLQRCPPLTVVGATTYPGDLPRPLLDRFGATLDFEWYTVPELGWMVKRHWLQTWTPDDDTAFSEAAISVAVRARGVPRLALRYAEGFVSYCLANGVLPSLATAEAYFALLGIDLQGLTPKDYRVLRYLANSPRPVGLNALATAVDLQPKEISDTIEPYLVRLGLVQRTASGRTVTEEGRRLGASWDADRSEDSDAPSPLIAPQTTPKEE